MRTIIAGSRSLGNLDNFIYEILDNHQHLITEVISGLCNGPDMIGYNWAKKNNILVREYPAKWRDTKDKKINYDAGKQRNTVMANNSDMLIAFWDGVSNGTYDMICKMSDKSRIIYRWDDKNRNFLSMIEHIIEIF